MRSNSTNSQVCLAFTVCCGLCPCKHRSCHSCWWKKAGPSHFVACNSFHQLQPDSGIAQVLFKIANLNFLQMPLLVFHTRVCNLIAFGMRCLLYYLFLINFFFFWGRVSCSPGRVFNSIPEDNFELLKPCLYLPQCWGYKCYSHSPFMLCWGFYRGPCAL